jgi:hypothetical protein
MYETPFVRFDDDSLVFYVFSSELSVGINASPIERKSNEKIVSKLPFAL